MIIDKKITIVGAGYVGMSLAALISQHNHVKVFDLNQDKVNKIKNNESTIPDAEINLFMAKKKLLLDATSEKNKAYANADFVIIATPTDYNIATNQFDTNSVDSIISDIVKHNTNTLIIIKSTIPVGHTKYLNKKYPQNKIIFSPEFLREGSALFDNLYPSRIVIGGKCKKSTEFANILYEAAIEDNIQLLFMDSSEAEAIKLFSNTFLAMRVSFFNELDTYAMSRNLDTRQIIEGVCLDKRIGSGYNNPSFGYGGYCLPKDTKQLLANYENIPQDIIKAIVQSNETRKSFITNEISKRKPQVVGFYRLIMKQGSDNYRESAVLEIIRGLKEKNIEVVIYEPNVDEDSFNNLKVIKNLSEFKTTADLIVANRKSQEIVDVKHKVFSRDIFSSDS